MSEQLILALPQKWQEYNHKIVSNSLVWLVGQNLTIYKQQYHHPRRPLHPSMLKMKQID